MYIVKLFMEGEELHMSNQRTERPKGKGTGTMSKVVNLFLVAIVTISSLFTFGVGNTASAAEVNLPVSGEGRLTVDGGYLIDINPVLLDETGTNANQSNIADNGEYEVIQLTRVTENGSEVEVNDAEPIKVSCNIC